MKKLLFVYNPNSGKGIIKNCLDEIIDIFESEDYSATIHRTKARLDGRDFVSRHGRDYDLVVCSGGDGTLSEIVSGIMDIEEESRPTIGFIPTGSTNDTGKSYYLPKNVREAALIAVKGNVFATDIGSFVGDDEGQNYFTYVSSFGELSAVSCFTPQSAKKTFGRAAYIAGGINALTHMKSDKFKVIYDGNTMEGEFYLGIVTNALSVGGFAGVTGGNVDLQDGLFEVILLSKPGNLGQFAEQVDSLLIAHKEEKKYTEGVLYKLKAREITFISETDVQWVIDGEDAGIHRTVCLKNNNKAVKIMSGNSDK